MQDMEGTVMLAYIFLDKSYFTVTRTYLAVLLK